MLTCRPGVAPSAQAAASIKRLRAFNVCQIPPKAAGVILCDSKNRSSGLLAASSQQRFSSVRVRGRRLDMDRLSLLMFRSAASEGNKLISLKLGPQPSTASLSVKRLAFCLASCILIS